MANENMLEINQQTEEKKNEKQKWRNRNPIYGNHECMTRRYKTKFNSVPQLILTANYSFQPSQI